VKALHQKWLCDKSSALCAAILAGTDLAVADRGERKRLEAATQFIYANVTNENARFLADSTLALLAKVPDMYRDHPDEELLPDATPLSGAASAAHAETERRNAGSQGLPDILIAHAVYLLKQPHLSMRDFLKWLKRTGGLETRDIGTLLKCLDGKQCVELDALLDLSKDYTQQTRDRIDAVDCLYDLVQGLADAKQNMLWWLRICLALRTSLYCWPLMVAGSNDHGLHGISLPIGMFLSPDGKSRVYFKIINPRSAIDHRPYVPGMRDVWSHMKGSHLHWNDEWARAFQMGLKVAKTLWSTQNGRLRFVDELAADAMMKASLVVDMGAACAIVHAVFDSSDGAPYRLSGRSAEAYWAQAVLGLMSPGRELPLGVVTGRIQMIDGVEEIHYVEGIEKKLQYANSAGFSRVVLPLERSIVASKVSESTNDLNGRDGEGEPTFCLDSTIDIADRPNDMLQEKRTSSASAEPQEGSVQHAVHHFLNSLSLSGDRKRIEINFCRSVRSAADAMQMSGWRRTAFVRLPETQRAFAIHLRRLFLLERVRSGAGLTSKDRREYDRNPWTGKETRELHKLDRYLLSDTRAIKFINRATLDANFASGAPAEIGRWLAWKDHQIRGGDDISLRGPALGILCLRATETDNEMRLWSAIAETLSASPEWWNQFQWSGVDQAARLIAQLLGNRRANPTICATPAPDLLVLFDEGSLTQRRTNPIFPDDYRGQWIDLLNPTKDDSNARHPLNEALISGEAGSLGTRIIVVYGESSVQPSELPESFDEEERDALDRLAVFRFNFSKQAAFAMMNYNRESDQRLVWQDVDERLKTLITKQALLSTRGHFYVAPPLLTKLREMGGYFADPHAHLHAAKALAPILEPRDLFIASNRDRTLEPESILEATWHIQRARVLVPARTRRVRLQCETALATLTFLRPSPDWDTVKLLQRSTATLIDAVELGRELLAQERAVTHEPPHSSRVAALLNALGEFGRSLNGNNAGAQRSQLADEATRLCADALDTFDASSKSDWHRQKRKLFSEYVYCMRLLNIPIADPRLAGSLRYLQGTIDEVVSADFYEHGDPDDYPMSRDWLRARWDDAELDARDRSTAAYVAARIHIDRRRDGKLLPPWDQPWIEYFALTTTADFDARQLHGPLATWQTVYGSDRETTAKFGQRVRDFGSFLAKKHEEISWWGGKIRAAADNLWEFISNTDPKKQLRVYETEIALRFIRTIAMYEALPAFDFIERRGVAFHPQWPKRFSRLGEWHELCSLVIGGEAGWTSMLSSCGEVDEQSIRLLKSWLHAYRGIGSPGLSMQDPEGLLLSTLPLADTYRRKRANAIWNGYQLLAKHSSGGWAIYGELRRQFLDLLRALDSNSNGWLFALANHKPHTTTVAGACMMLEHGVSAESIRVVVSKPALAPFRRQLLHNIPEWSKYANEVDRRRFEHLRQSLTSELRFLTAS
jgi:hypothetical protein